MDPNNPTPADPPQKSARELELEQQLAAAQQQNATLTEQLAAAKTAQEAQMDAEGQKKIDEMQKQLDASENARKTAESERDQARGDNAALKSQALLTGKVRDVNAAQKLLTPEMLDKDGNPDTAKLLEAYPFLAPDGAATAPAQPAATAPGGAGDVQTGAPTSLDKAVDSKDIAAINSAFDAEMKPGAATGGNK